MKKILLNLILLFLINSLFAQPAFINDSLDIYIKREMERWQVPGLAIAIVKDGKIVLCKGYGVKESGKKDAVNEYTLFQIASNSKAFTGTAIALLNYEKRLSLDQKVTNYLPYFKLYDTVATQLCTVRDLLCHRIGLFTFQGDFLNWGSTLTRKEIVEHLQFTKPVYRFRYNFGYCNAAFVTAGEVIKTVTDTSWDDFIGSRFFEPLEMKHTNTSYLTMLNDKNACKPHTLVNNKLLAMPLTNIDNMSSSAAINSCARDMANWLLFQLDSGRFNGRRLIPFSVLAETRKSQMVVSDVNSRLFKTKHFTTYGLGWFSYDYEARRIWEHSGGSNGFVTKTEFIPEENLGVLVYTNSDANSLYEALCKQIIEAYLKMPYRNLSEKYFIPSQQGYIADQKELDSLQNLVQIHIKTPVDFKKYEAAYSNELYGKIEIRNVKNQLRIIFSNHPQNTGNLKYIGDHKFLCTYSDPTLGVQVIPFEMLNGIADSVTIKVADFIDYQSYLFKRL
ncbi:MAG: serine hydrolase [Bacteroidia bacterium]|nr:serine hydrolase [Bacteroidia bacterium]